MSAVGARTAIIVALPREAAALVRGWQAHKQHHHRGIYLWTRDEAVVVAAGMGATRATLAVEAALATGPIGLLISAGLAGACHPELAVGRVAEAAEVIDVRTGERFRTAARQNIPFVLATGSSIASVREKARLLASYHASAVDMEAATVARLALANGIAFRAIKAISDDFSFELAALDRFVTHHGHFHTRRFGFHTAARPHTWRKTMRLGRHSAQALTALTEELRQTLADVRDGLHPTP